MVISKALFSTRVSDDYETPKDLFDYLNDVFAFMLDPCARLAIEGQKRINTKVKYTIDDNGLNKGWINYSTFVNPPYSHIRTWVDKCLAEFKFRMNQYAGTQWAEHKPSPIVLLVPARTDTTWWHRLVSHPLAKVIFIKGRLKFNNCKTNAPFPSAIVILSVTSIFDRFIDTATDEFHRITLIPTWTLDIRKT